MLSRIKFDIEDLFTEILNHIPEEVFNSKDTTFVDVEAAGGQSYNAIKKKLLKAGHTEENIRKRVTMFFNNSFEQNYAINKNSVDCNTEVHNIMEKTVAKKFDVVIGNPPYNWSSDDGKQRKNNRENLWTRFVTKGFEDLVKENGYVSMIVPKTWMSPSRDFGTTVILQDYFAKNNTVCLNIDECGRHFNVGSSFSYFVVKVDNSKNRNTKLVTNEGESNIDLSSSEWKMGIPTILHKDVLTSVSKFFRTDSFFDWSRQYEGQINSISNKGKFKVFHTPATLGKTFSNDKSYLHDRKKVMVSLSGKYQPFYDNGDCSPSGMIVCLLLKDNESIKSAESVFSSKLYSLMIDKVFRYNGWLNGNILKALPSLDLTKIWSDEEIYKEFKLTKKEIKAIEKNY